ncbi:MAG: hypothetical protein DMF82_06435 [Acidobacteria bacterium]|nr:MAG: hypothetical protein DMF82_06435 [Acidobacteriota bacterium]
MRFHGIQSVVLAVSLSLLTAPSWAQSPDPSPSPQPPDQAPPPAAPEPPPPTPAPSPEPPAAPPPTEVPPGAAGAGGPSGPLPVYGPASSKVFNPDMAVIGDFLGAIGKNDSGRATPSLELHEAEASFQAIVDPYARADFFLTFSPDEVGVEEGFITFTSLPANFLVKVGKMRGSFGKVNQMHNHVMPWTDRPLVTQNLVGGEEGISDAGISVSRLFPNEILFLEATAEVYRGESPELFRAPTRGDLTYVGRVRGYRDLTESTNLDFGGSFAQGHNDAGPSFKTRLWGADLAFRWRPLRRAIYRRLILRTEAVWSRKELETGAAKAFGAYVSGEYQFAQRWFAGVRLDRSDRADDPSLQDKGVSALLTYWPSEFSQIRGQYRYTKYAEDIKANELLFQVQFSIGAHGAHTF